MSGSEEKSLLELTIVRAEGLERHRVRKFHIECSIDGKVYKTKKKKQKSKTDKVEWNKTFMHTLDNTQSARLKLRVHLNWSTDNALVEKDLSELISLQGTDIPLSLTTESGSSLPGTLIIRLKVSTKEDAVGAVVSHADSLLEQMNASSSVYYLKSEKALTILEHWESLVGHLLPALDLIQVVSELHPYTKALWKLISLIPEALKSQIERDKKIEDLIDDMKDVYVLILDIIKSSAKDSKDLEMFKDFFSKVLDQTLECGRFIQEYAKDTFGKRMLKSFAEDVNKDIEEFQSRFRRLRSCLQERTNLNNAIVLYRMKNVLTNLAVVIDLKDIFCAERMEYHESSCCAESTRQDDLMKIEEWIEHPKQDERVLLLTDQAGSGKTTIAHTIASKYKSKNQLASSFFFSSNKLTDSLPGKLFGTIAIDLSDLDPQIKLRLWNAVKDSTKLRKTDDVQEQFKHLVCEPLADTVMKAPVVIVIDALDECGGDAKDKERLLNILATEMEFLPEHFRVIITAREDEDIERAFRSPRSVYRFRMESIKSKTIKEDVSKYIKSALSDFEDLFSSYRKDWLPHLTKISGGLFIWASTACNFICERKAGVDPKERLDIVLQVSTDNSAGDPFHALYSLYGRVLEKWLTQEESGLERYRAVIGAILVAPSPVSSKTIDDLFNGSYSSSHVIPYLGALLTNPTEPVQPVELLHASFRDFLMNESISGKFYIDTKEQHAKMARYCLDLMNRELKFNVCGFGDPFTLYKDMPEGDLSRRIKDNIGEALQYACRYWTIHFMQMNPIDYVTVKESLHRLLFGDKHLMQWVEVVSILKMSVIILKPLRDLVKWLKRVRNEEKTRRLLYDCIHFLDKYSVQISYGPLHAYHSALPYIPAKTVLRDVYCELSGLEPCVIFGLKEEWSLLRSELQMDGSVRAAAFSPNGARVACALDGCKLQIFDFATSAALGEPVECSVVRIHALVFSPDGIHLAISTPDFIEVWNAETMACLVHDTSFTMRGRLPIAFLSNNLLVACRVNGRRVELWSRSLSDVDPTIHTFLVDQDVRLVVMSPSGLFFGYLTESGNVFVWDTQSQEEIAHFKVDHPYERYVLGISSDGEYIATSQVNRVTMWSRAKGEIIWSEEYGDEVKKIWMPLSTQCGLFVTSSLHWDYVWDLATGEHYLNGTRFATAVSADGCYLVTEKGDIYSIDDADRSCRELSSKKADMNKQKYLKGEYLMHMQLLSDGSLSAAGRNGNTIFTWDRLGTAEARKHMLEGHTSAVQKVRLSPDGVKLASKDKDNNIFVWLRNSASVHFELQEQHKLENIHHLDMTFAPNGNLILAEVTADQTISVCEQFGMADATKYTLEKHRSINSIVMFSADGMKVASQEKNNTVYVFAKPSRDVRFELLSSHVFGNENSARAYLADSSRWGEDITTLATTERTRPEECLLSISEVSSGELASKPRFRYDEEYSEWVTTAEGKILWWIPNRFRGWKCTQLGNRMVVYNRKSAVLFTYDDNATSTRKTRTT